MVRLLGASPFAWRVSASGDDAAFTPLPLRAPLVPLDEAVEATLDGRGCLRGQAAG